MRSTLVGMLLMSALALAAPAASADPADCKLAKVAELPLRLEDNQALVDVTLNGQPVRALLDTGADLTTLSKSGAERLGLELTGHDRIHGIGGEARVGTLTVSRLAAGDWWAADTIIHVAEHDNPAPGVEMVLGQDIFAQYDIELDVTNGAVRFFRPRDCAGVPLAYWADTYAQAPLRVLNGGVRRHNQVRVAINGYETWALLDTGAMATQLFTRTARRANVNEDGAGITRGPTFHGVGGKSVSTRVGIFDTFTIGEETIRGVRLAFGDFSAGFDPDATEMFGMMLGMDFIKAHRIYIANSQGRIYFTNVSRPVFAPPQQAAGN
ncbi:retroviral-like aspartic protease family protein [Nitrospirillum sp. BR 11163]|uniref:retroviral-like aspartic protease family protein n=1 Tax=Nitrospirillum sp. BR 11163 TaxID=3104323 RepID=UPI002AFF1850|nr:retroviral-like aspartic protease family protein [Nitrospirillum sp. BR 11163]MEA1673899.1 retroviral-like aspartic protease family protein [Nitrospirillum sp. BR 11163]